jgi:hypothetical protein
LTFCATTGAGIFGVSYGVARSSTTGGRDLRRGNGEGRSSHSAAGGQSLSVGIFAKRV